jgi:hypothetical protein
LPCALYARYQKQALVLVVGPARRLRSSEMLPARANGDLVLVDHTSPHGKTATHMRGTMLVNSIDNLRAVGVYEQYCALLPAAQRDHILFAIATSWVPMELALLHYETCEQLDLDELTRRRVAELMAERVARTFFSALLKTVRIAGVSSFILALKQNDRLYDRMYQGGRVRVLQTGPKDFVLENHGLPLVQNRYWRVAYQHYLTAVVQMFTKTAYLKQVRPEQPDPHAIAFAGCWV